MGGVKNPLFLACAPTRGHPYFGSLLEPSGINRSLLTQSYRVVLSYRIGSDRSSIGAERIDGVEAKPVRSTRGRGAGGEVFFTIFTKRLRLSPFDLRIFMNIAFFTPGLV